MEFVHAHSDHHDMKMTVKSGCCDAARLTGVMGLCHFLLHDIVSAKVSENYFFETMHFVVCSRSTGIS